MRLLVAGGAGYIGSMLVPALIECGYDVDVIDLLWFGNYLPRGTSLTRKELFQCTEDDLRKYEQVIFLAGISNDPMAEYAPSHNFIYNGALPSYLAYLAKKAGVKRYVYASSCSVYGYNVSELCHEESSVKCGYPYGISKLQGERGVCQLQDSSFSTIVLRQGTVCGWSPRMRFDLIVNGMYKNAVVDGVVVVNNPSIWRPILDVRDACSAFMRAIQADYRISGTFNVASANYVVGHVGDLVKGAIESVLKKRVRLDLKNVQEYRSYKVSCDSARITLGFEPRYTVADTISSLHEHYEAYGDMESENYYNIRSFVRQIKPEPSLTTPDDRALEGVSARSRCGAGVT
jgi:nucleoside-diphosphate-sugar epimerase